MRKGLITILPPTTTLCALWMHSPLPYAIPPGIILHQLHRGLQTVLSRMIPPNSICQLCKRNQICHQLPRVAITSGTTEYPRRFPPVPERRPESVRRWLLQQRRIGRYSTNCRWIEITMICQPVATIGRIYKTSGSNSLLFHLHSSSCSYHTSANSSELTRVAVVMNMIVWGYLLTADYTYWWVLSRCEGKGAGQRVEWRIHFID